MHNHKKSSTRFGARAEFPLKTSHSHPKSILKSQPNQQTQTAVSVDSATTTTERKYQRPNEYYSERDLSSSFSKSLVLAPQSRPQSSHKISGLSENKRFVEEKRPSHNPPKVYSAAAAHAMSELQKLTLEDAAASIFKKKVARVPVRVERVIRVNKDMKATILPPSDFPVQLGDESNPFIRYIVLFAGVRVEQKYTQ
jgi:hypothetical protein